MFYRKNWRYSSNFFNYFLYIYSLIIRFRSQPHWEGAAGRNWLALWISRRHICDVFFLFILTKCFFFLFLFFMSFKSKCLINLNVNLFQKNVQFLFLWIEIRLSCSQLWKYAALEIELSFFFKNSPYVFWIYWKLNKCCFEVICRSVEFVFFSLSIGNFRF